MNIYKKGRLGSIIRDSLAVFLREELQLPPGRMVSIADVEISERGSLARVYISIYPFGECALEKQLKKLENKASGYLRVRLRLKHIPRVRFTLSRGEDFRERIEKIIEGEKGKGADKK